MKRLARLGLIGASVATSSVLTIGMGVVSADSITDTGPGSYNSIVSRVSSNEVMQNTNQVSLTNSNNQSAATGSADASGNTNGGYGGGQQQSDWGSWNPTSWQQQGRSFGDWWGSMMSHMASCNSSSWTGSGMNNWMPGGSDWQSTWGNWDPMLWQQHGASYGSWYGMMMPYMSNHYATWQQGWNGGSSGANGGSASTGNASNNNVTQAAVTITNNTPTPAVSSYTTGGNTGMRNNTISDTGPHSVNTIKDIHSSSTMVTNTNSVTVNNMNMQMAKSGNASVSGNTFGGSARSGNAMNSNSSSFMLSLINR